MQNLFASLAGRADDCATHPQKHLFIQFNSTKHDVNSQLLHVASVDIVCARQRLKGQKIFYGLFMLVRLRAGPENSIIDEYEIKLNA